VGVPVGVGGVDRCDVYRGPHTPRVEGLPDDDVSIEANETGPAPWTLRGDG
jgi:hypothetical protein